MGWLDLFGLFRSGTQCACCRSVTEEPLAWDGEKVCVRCYTELKLRHDKVIERRRIEEEARERIQGRQVFGGGRRSA